MDRRLFLSSLGAGYELVPISGVVKYKGQPLDDKFHIEFTPKDGSRPSMARINADGSFEAVHTASQKGVKPGSNEVIVYWNADPTVTPVPDEYKEMIAKYGFTGTDKLTVEITKKDNNFEVNYE